MAEDSQDEIFADIVIQGEVTSPPGFGEIQGASYVHNASGDTYYSVFKTPTIEPTEVPVIKDGETRVYTLTGATPGNSGNNSNVMYNGEPVTDPDTIRTVKSNAETIAKKNTHIIFVKASDITRMWLSVYDAEKTFKFSGVTEMVDHFKTASKTDCVVTIGHEKFGIMFDPSYPMAVSRFREKQKNDDDSGDTGKKRKRTSSSDPLFGYPGKRGSTWVITNVDKNGKATLSKCTSQRDKSVRNVSKWNLFCKEFNAFHHENIGGVLPNFKSMNPILAQAWKTLQTTAIDKKLTDQYGGTWKMEKTQQVNIEFT